MESDDPESTLGAIQRKHIELLCADIEDAMRPIHRLWARDGGTVDPFLLLWPERNIKLSDGSELGGPQLRQLPRGRKGRWSSIIDFEVQRLKACALCLVHDTPSGVRVLLETPYGTRCWSYEKEKRGDVWRLREPELTENKEYVGLLWRPALTLN